MRLTNLSVQIGVAVGVFASMVAAAFAEPAPFMMRATVRDRLIEGQPLAWTQQQMLLLGRDGVLYEFDPAEAKEASRFGDKFVPYSPSELSALLKDEFETSFEVTTTAHFVVVHPRGEWKAWADRLETLFRSFTHYMSVRGFESREPAVPLVAVVFRNEDHYLRHAAASGTRLQPGTLGHYDPISNRVFLFDIAGATGDAEWDENAATIIHEATHQTAYNVGVHRRFAEQSRWVVEGLAMMFEAPGVWNASSLHSQVDRINAGRLDYFRRTAEERQSDWLVQLTASDLRFDADPMSAYAEAWMLSFYLCETRPQEYSAYLARMASRKAFSKYSPLERMTDFTAAFGKDFELLTAQLNRFVEELP
jgi:hypothetical protein